MQQSDDGVGVLMEQQWAGQGEQRREGQGKGRKSQKNPQPKHTLRVEFNRPQDTQKDAHLRSFDGRVCRHGLILYKSGQTVFQLHFCSLFVFPCASLFVGVFRGAGAVARAKDACWAALEWQARCVVAMSARVLACRVR
jgi:hypothetical protein